MRRVEMTADVSLSCTPVALRVLPGAPPVPCGPGNAEAACLGWAKLNAAAEFLDSALDHLPDAHAVGRADVGCLLAVAIVMTGGRPSPA